MRQIGNPNHLAKLQLADIRIDMAGNIGRQTFDLDFAQQQLKDAALQLSRPAPRP